MDKNQILGREVNGIELVLCECANCPDTRTTLAELQKLVQFVDPRPKSPSRPEHHPERRRTEPDGSIIVPISIIHPALGRDVKLFSVGWQIGVASFTYLSKSHSICFMQTNSTNAATLEEMVCGMVQLAKIVSPALAPAYGWIDVTVENSRPRQINRFSDVRHWFFGNIFGRKIIDDAPRNFFADFPAYERCSFADGSILLTSAPSFSDWYFSPPSDVLQFLRVRSPQIRALGS